MTELSAVSNRQGGAVGFDGLAGVGWEPASHLARAGHALVVHDADLDRAHDFARAFPCRVANDMAGLAALGLVLFAPQGTGTRDRIASVAQYLRPGAIVVDLGASDPCATRELGMQLAQRGVVLIDAPLCGGAPDAGAAAIVHGCDDESALDVALPVLRALGCDVMEGGALGCGQAIRLVETHVHACILAAASEALLAGDRLGLASESLRARIQAAIRRSLDPEAMWQPGAQADNFTAGLALGLFAKGRASELATPAHAPGLTRLLIEFTTPVSTKETLR